MATGIENKWSVEQVIKDCDHGDIVTFTEEEFNKIIKMDIDYYEDEEEEKLTAVNGKNNKFLVNLKRVPKVNFGNVDLPFANIEKFIQAKDGNEGYFATYSELNYIEYKYQEINNSKRPNVFRLDGIYCSKFVGNLLKHYEVPSKSYIQYIHQNEGDPKLTGFLLALQNDFIIYFDSTTTGAIYYNKDLEKDKESLLYKVLGLIRICKQPITQKNKIFIVYRDMHGFNKIGFDVKKVKINIEENYNEDFPPKAEEIVNWKTWPKYCVNKC